MSAEATDKQDKIKAAAALRKAAREIPTNLIAIYCDDCELSFYIEETAPRDMDAPILKGMGLSCPWCDGECPTPPIKKKRVVVKKDREAV